jgi:hypothetical protein
MADKVEHTKLHIERAIGRARQGVGERIDEIDKNLRSRLDWKRQAGDHAVEVVVAGTALGFFLAVGGAKTVVRAVQLTFPIVMAIHLAKRKAAQGSSR